ncbi:unnamed protein product [Bursaphelenchus okinawaensis]|uniref:PDZ domain-containing protein n=1 Tax=Bursaphelenchus okinawaensis TaxID=465554 RepID=A0A811LQA2_9BILA|nr:unnamed protein product [Bursaphelenchus okinawaensis]CAG9127847.1 unnamed protein product [Bursaphelenchus okinawaensis]
MSTISNSDKDGAKLAPPPKEYLDLFVVPKPLGVRINKTSFRVTYVETNSPLLNRAFVGDQLVAIDGQTIRTPEELAKKLSEKKHTHMVQFKHAYFSYCVFLGSSVEKLQLEKEVLRTTGRAVNIFMIHIAIPNLSTDNDEDRRDVLQFTVRYDARERVQVAYCDPNGLAAIHLKPGDVIREVNEHPIASKAMLRYWISEAVNHNEPVQLNIERLVCGDDAIRDMIETPQDVLDIAQKQIQKIKTRAHPTPTKILRRTTGRKGNVKMEDKVSEVDIHADHDPTKLKPCKGAKS